MRELITMPSLGFGVFDSPACLRPGAGRAARPKTRLPRGCTRGPTWLDATVYLGVFHCGDTIINILTSPTVWSTTDVELKVLTSCIRYLGFMPFPPHLNPTAPENCPSNCSLWKAARWENISFSFHALTGEIDTDSLETALGIKIHFIMPTTCHRIAPNVEMGIFSPYTPTERNSLKNKVTEIKSVIWLITIKIKWKNFIFQLPHKKIDSQWEFAIWLRELKPALWDT